MRVNPWLVTAVMAASFGVAQWFDLRSTQLRDETIRVLEQRVMEANRALARCDSLAWSLDTTSVIPWAGDSTASFPASVWPRPSRPPVRMVRAVVAGDTLFVGFLTCTVPSTEQAFGQCAGNGVPDSGASYARIQLRANHPDSVWRDGWTVGMSQAAGRSIVFPITGIRQSTWARLAPVDTTGNQACWSDSTLLMPRTVVP